MKVEVLLGADGAPAEFATELRPCGIGGGAASEDARGWEHKVCIVARLTGLLSFLIEELLPFSWSPLSSATVRRRISPLTMLLRAWRCLSRKPLM